MIINDTFVNVNEYNQNSKLDTTIIITHGLGEYSKSYIETAEKLMNLENLTTRISFKILVYKK